MKRYEYQTLQTDFGELGEKGLLERINRMGDEGWNLVSTVSHERHGYSREVHLFFSREVAEAERSSP